MNTTLLFAELIIVGLQASVWIILGITCIFGHTWIAHIQSSGLDKWQAALLAVLLSFAYVFGIIVDRLSDRIFSNWEKRTKKRELPRQSIGLRFLVARDNEYLNRQLEYMRSRVRISRTSILNFALTTVAAETLLAVYSHKIPSADPLLIALGILIFGVALTAGAAYSFEKSMVGFYRLLREYIASTQLEAPSDFDNADPKYATTAVPQNDPPPR